MFNSLKLKLTFINVGITGLIILFLTSGIYIITRHNLEIQTRQLMLMIASDSETEALYPTEGEERNRLNYFYVVINNSGKFTKISARVPMPPEQIQILADTALNSGKPTGRLWLQDNKSLSFLISPEKNRTEATIVFVSDDYENKVLEELLTALIISSLFGLTLVFLSSLYVAEKALRPIKKSWERQKNFVADASHELRTPLSVIQTNLEVVLDNPHQSVENQEKWLDNIKKETERMADLVNDLLFLARADSQQKILLFKEFDLDSLLVRTLKTFEPLAVNKNITLKSSIYSQVKLWGDESRIQQVVVILLDNAIKYTPQTGEITLELKDAGNSVEITVSDTGQGIDEKHLDKIFERFYRVDDARSKKSGGTGLGLAIAQWIIKEHHGTIKIESLPEKGSRFI
ncbi:MAG: GHKL domain-containing protein, partial [Peptococcaceae bacterium]|nr:GHKL domain-containing protein [Peptococcaceae bacterium]